MTMTTLMRIIAMKVDFLEVAKLGNDDEDHQWWSLKHCFFAFIAPGSLSCLSLMVLMEVRKIQNTILWGYCNSIWFWWRTFRTRRTQPHQSSWLFTGRTPFLKLTAKLMFYDVAILEGVSIPANDDFTSETPFFWENGLNNPTQKKRSNFLFYYRITCRTAQMHLKWVKMFLTPSQLSKISYKWIIFHG